MNVPIPSLDTDLNEAQVSFVQLLRRQCAVDILRMLKTSQSGHPGGSLSSLDLLATLYAYRVSQTDERVVVSNGHISPAVYAILAEMGVVDREEVIAGFRQYGSEFEGHVTRHIAGIAFGTGPLGVGVSAAAGMALAAKRQGSDAMVWALMGDGEAQEGQVHEMALFAAKENLSNYCLFVDYNRVQLSASLEETMPIDLEGLFSSWGWNVLTVDGHNPVAIWQAMRQAKKSNLPTAIIAQTIMGQGVPGMQEDGEKLIPTWHGKAPKPEDIDGMVAQIELSSDEKKVLDDFRAGVGFTPLKTPFAEALSPIKNFDAGEPTVYAADVSTDCRTAYGKALADLGARNKSIFAFTADLGGSVMTKFIASEHPEQFAEAGICEQNMVSMAGGMSLSGAIPFASTFGAFLTSRAKDQARVNDINQTNVKLVATHCGLSVGEDGPTHQAIDDMGAMLGHLNTHILEPADPNHCDRMIRYIAAHWGNFYLRMGRAKLPILTREDGSVLFDADYKYHFGRCDILRSGSAATIVATGATVAEALAARGQSGIDAEIVVASSIQAFDETFWTSVRKTKRIITVEDHNVRTGLGGQVAFALQQAGVSVEAFLPLGVTTYQLSGKPAELYKAAGIDSQGIIEALMKIVE